MSDHANSEHPGLTCDQFDIKLGMPPEEVFKNKPLADVIGYDSHPDRRLAPYKDCPICLVKPGSQCVANSSRVCDWGHCQRVPALGMLNCDAHLDSDGRRVAAILQERAATVERHAVEKKWQADHLVMTQAHASASRAVEDATHKLRKAIERKVRAEATVKAHKLERPQ